MQPHTFKLGKNPAVFDRRSLSFGRYLTSQLPPPPPSVDWSSAVARWPMYLNDRYGDCTCAAVGHMIEAWTASAHAPRQPTDAAILGLYEHFTPPGPDNGCNMLDVLKYWRSHGVAGDRIGAFALLEQRSIVQARQAIALFGGCYIGVMLPDFVADAPDLLAVPWTVPPYGTRGDGAPDPEAGHCINAVGYDATHVHVVTWGRIKAMSWGFYQDYSDEAYAVLSSDFLAQGRTPAGFDLAQLQADLAAINRLKAA